MLASCSGSTLGVARARSSSSTRPDGGCKGSIVELERMLPAYYRSRGWDEGGVPTRAKLEELGLLKI